MSDNIPPRNQNPQLPADDENQLPAENQNPNVMFWDIENALIPADITVAELYDTISNRLRELGYTGPLRFVQGVVARSDLPSFPEKRKQKFRELAEQNDIEFYDCEEPTGKKQVADTELVRRINLWLNQRHPYSNLFMISGDKHFEEVLEDASRDHNVIIVSIPSNHSKALKKHGWISYGWRFFLTGQCQNDSYTSRKDEEGDDDGSKPPKRNLGSRFVTALAKLIGCI